MPKYEHPQLDNKCVCVTLGIMGILSDCFSFTVVFLVQQGRVALSSYHTQ